MLMREDGKPRGFWNLIRVERPIRGADGTVRGAVIHVPSKGSKTTTLRRPPLSTGDEMYTRDHR